MSTSSSSGESVSSSSSSSSANSPATPHAAAVPPAPVQSQKCTRSAVPDSSDNDDESDVSMAADSDSDDSDNDNDVIISASVAEQPQDQTVFQGQKRKISAVIEASITNDLSHPTNHKKYKTSINDGPGYDKSLLPPEIWHQIFTFVPPKALGCLLRVNKRFNSYLDPSSSVKPVVHVPLSPSTALFRQPDAIWLASRRLYRPGIPSPLDGRTELDMWRLVLSTTCQFCRKKSAATSSSPIRDQWHTGPGVDGVRPVWLLGVRSCGRCLLNCTIKEIDLLLSSSIPTLLMSAIPFIFLTNELHVVSANTLASGALPNAAPMEKLYSKSGIEAVKNEFFRVKTMGSGTAEEWLKGLDERGKAMRNDAARWERFEAMQGIARMRTVDVAELVEIISRRPAPSLAHNPQMLPTNGVAVVQAMTQQSTPSLPVSTTQTPGQPAMPVVLPKSGLSAPTVQLPPRPGIAYSLPAAPVTPIPFGGRHQRTREEVMELKAARKAEIERRALLLPEPIAPALLCHMSAFQAALQIIHPFDDHAWELLLPRLLAQRSEAERRETERLEHTRVIQAQQAELEARRLQAEAHAQAQAAAQAQAHAQAQAQAQAHLQAQARAQAQLQAQMQAQYNGYIRPDPVDLTKERLDSYADELINSAWHSGRSVSASNAPKFAADVLCHVRHRFYSSNQQDGSKSMVMNNQRPDATSRILTLDNMKGVFDSKIRPITERYGREIFLCPECDIERFYGFEAVIQHYAAKHTEDLSLGNIVVNWKAEWPEDPPFNAHPMEKSTPHPQLQGMPRFGAGPPEHSQLSGDSASQNYPHPIARQSEHPNNGFTTEYDIAANTNLAQVVGQDPATPVSNDGLLAQQQTGTIRTEEYRIQLLEVARDASAVWQSIGNVKDMPGSVRIFVVLHHIVEGYKKRHDEVPTLAMLNDGLSNNKDMRPIRNINGLACRACILEETRKDNCHTKPVKGGKPQEKKLLSTPQLWTHFLKTHIEATEGPIQYDWTTDMVELPDMKKIRSLKDVKSMTEEMLQLVREALPEAFIATPPPVVKSPIQYDEPEVIIDNSMYGDYRQNGDDLPEGQDSHDKYYTRNDPSLAARNAVDEPANSSGMQQATQKISNRERRRREKLLKRKARDSNRDDDGDYAGGYDTRKPPPNHRNQGRRNSRENHSDRRPTYQNNERYAPPHRDQNLEPDDYLEGPRYYNAGASLAELLANPGAAANLAATRPPLAAQVVEPVQHRPSPRAHHQSLASTGRYLDEDQASRYAAAPQEPLPNLPQPSTGRRHVEGFPPPTDAYTPVEYPYEPQSARIDPYERIPQPRPRYQQVIVDDYEEEEEIIYVDQHGRRIAPPPLLRRYEPVPSSARPRSRSPIQHRYHGSELHHVESRDVVRPTRAHPEPSMLPYREDNGYEPVPPQDMYRYEQVPPPLRAHEQFESLPHQRPHSGSYEPVEYLPRDTYQRQPTQPPSRQAVSRYEADPRYEPVPRHESLAPRPQHFEYDRPPVGGEYNGVGSMPYQQPQYLQREERRQPSGGSDEYDPSNPTMFSTSAARGDMARRR